MKYEAVGLDGEISRSTHLGGWDVSSNDGRMKSGERRSRRWGWFREIGDVWTGYYLVRARASGSQASYGHDPLL